MEKLVSWIDRTAGIDSSATSAVTMLERIAFIFLILTTVSLPHSIAATQTAWILGMLAWVIRIILKPRPRFKPEALDYALWAFFGWSVVSALASYAPDISIDKLRVVTLFLIGYFAYHNIRNIGAAKFIASALIFSAMFAVLWTPLERLIGRGVQVYEFRGGPFEAIGLDEGDTILEVNGNKVRSLDEIRDRIAESPSKESFKAKVYHSDSYVTVDIPTDRIKPSESSSEALSVGRWRIGRSWRAAGFYGHYTTFAEMLQLVISLTFGIFASLISKTGHRRSVVLLAVCLVFMAFAMILTATRASQLALAISGAIILLTLGNRRMLITAFAIVIPLGIAGLFVIQKTRGVGFFDPNDNSTTWRQTVYREGLGLWTASPRNFVLGVGMDSIKRYAKDWHLFDDGRLPMGHFHSTPLQIAVERGLPALVLWLAFCAIYWRRLYGFRSDDPVLNGIVTGVLGGAIGFFISGLVHYNLGDSEVAMVFFFLMGVGLAIGNTTRAEANA